MAICPVDTFALVNARVFVRPEQEDTCILCEACLGLALVRPVVVQKKYKEQRLVNRADALELGNPAG